MEKAIGLAILALGAILIFKMLLAGWLLFLLSAAVLAIGASMGVIGKWGYAGAALFGLLALPALLFKTTFLALGMLVRFLPILLIGYGAYVLLKGFSRRT